MNVADYQALSQRTSQWQPDHHEYRTPRHVHYAAFTIAGESGEVVDALKKEIFSAHPADRQKLKLELGDTSWGVACMCEAFGLRFERVVKRACVWRGETYEGFTVEEMALSLACGAGVVADLARTPLMGHDADDMGSRLVGVMAPVWIIAEHLGFTLEEVLAANIAKLAARYPSGSYSHADSIARRDVEGAPTANHRCVATIDRGSVSTAPGAIEEGEG